MAIAVKERMFSRASFRKGGAAENVVLYGGRKRLDAAVGGASDMHGDLQDVGEPRTNEVRNPE